MRMTSSNAHILLDSRLVGCTLLRWVVEDIDIPVRGIRIRDVESRRVALAQCNQLLVVLLRQCHLLEVRLDAFCSFTQYAGRLLGDSHSPFCTDFGMTE